MTKTPNVAWVAFRGRNPGIYLSWEECEEQIKGFAKAKHMGFKSFHAASLAWEEWQRKVAAIRAAASAPQPAPLQNTTRPWQEALHPPTPWIEPPARQQAVAPVPPRSADASQVHPSSDPWQPSTSQPTPYYNAPHPELLMPGNMNVQRLPDPEILYPQLPPTDSQVYYPQLRSPQSSQERSSPLLPSQHFGNLPRPAGYVDLTSPSAPLPASIPSLKRPASYIDLTDDFENEIPAPKRIKPEIHTSEAPILTNEEKYELNRLEPRPKPKPVHKEARIELSPEQEKVVNMAMRKNNIFLTGAAGCGKTVTLKEILARLKKKARGGNVQVIAPTGIAALPLEGKTTYSFAGWNPDSMRKGIVELLKKPKISVVKAINDLDVLIIEEISMVENQFLERLNLLFQNALMNKLPFGGKQVIFLGDFHQLPPVKPFEFCLQCGESIPDKPEVVCVSSHCKANPDQITFIKKSDKWAFRAPVWRELKLRHVRLEQIHRQKDTRFKDILNKIRNGMQLEPAEWADLEREKDVPKGAFAVRLMSRLNQVQYFNESQLNALKSQPKTWHAYDVGKKLIQAKEGEWQDPNIPHKIREYRDTLKDHRFLQVLTLKVGARVVLLQNLSSKLVNGSQGIIVGFAHATQELEKIMETSGEHQSIRQESMTEYHRLNPPFRPLVQFANGVKELIPAYASASIRGGSAVHEQYVVCRTQIPLALAWALSIHKSQGMTLDYVEVSSRDIFESGQLYVALSRATRLDGLRLTGYDRKLLPMDGDVLEFYMGTKWENLQPRGARKKQKA